MRDVGRPEDSFASGDPSPLVVHPDPAAALDHDEPGGVRVGVRFDRGAACERHLADRPPPVRMDELAGDAGRAGRAVSSAVADAEPSDVDRHGPSGVAAAGDADHRGA